MSDVKITVGIDDSELQKQLKDINSDLKQTNKIYNELGKSNNFAKQLDTAQEKAELLTKKMSIQQKQIDACEDELKQYKRQLDGLEVGSEEFVKLTGKIEKTESKLKDLKSAFKLTDAQMESTQSNIKGLENKLNSLEDSVDSLGDEFDDTVSDIEKFEKSLDDIDSDLKQIDKIYKEFGKGNNFVKQLEAGQQKAELLTTKMKLQQEQIDKCTDELKEYKRQLDGLDSGSDEFVELNNKIEQTESRLKGLNGSFRLTEAQLDSTGLDIKSLENKLESLGGEFDDTKSDVKSFENALEGVSSEAKQTGGAFDGLKSTLKSLNFQAIGQSIQNAGQSMYNFGSNIISGFIDGLDESKEFTAELETQEFLLKQLPKSVQDVIDKLGSVSVDFGFTELQIEQVATEMASFLERNKLTESVDLTEMLSRAMDLSAMYDLDINDVVERIQKMMLGNFENSDALGFNMNVASIEEFLGVDWDKLSYAEQQLASLEYIMAQTEATTGRATQEAEGFSSQWNLAKQNLNETKNTILSYVQEAILPYIQKLNECIEPVRKWMEAHKELVAKIAIGVGIFGALAVALGAILIPLGSIIALIPVFSTLFSGIGTVLGAIVSPIGLVVTAIGALVAGLVYVYNHSEKFKEVVDKTWNGFKDTIQKAIDFVRPYIEKFIAWLPGAWDSATGFLSDVWIGLVEGVIDACGKVKDFIVSFWEKHGDTISDIFSRAWGNAVQTFETLKSGVETVFNALKSFWDEWGGTITSFFTTLWENIKTGWEIGWNAIKTVFDIVSTGILGALQVFFQILDGDFSGAWDTIKETTKTVWGTLKDFIVESMGKILEAVKTGFGWIRDNAPIIWGAFVDFIKEKATQLKDFIVEKFQEITPKVAEFLKELPGNIYNWLCEVLPKIIEWGSNMISKIGEALGTVYDIAKQWFVDNIIPKFKEWIDNIVNKFVEMKDKAIEKVKEMVEKLKKWWDELPYNLGLAIGKALKAVIDWGKEMVAKAKETGKNFLDKVIEFFKQLPTKIKAFIDDTISKVKTWANDMKTKAIETGKNFIDGVVNFIKELPGKVRTYIDNTLTSVKTWATNMISKAKETGTKFVNGVIDFIKTLPSKFMSKLNDVISKVTTFISNLKSKATQAGNSFGSSLISALSKIPSQVLSIGTRIVQSLWNGISTMGGWLRSKFSGFVDGLVAGITGGKDTLRFDVGLTSEYGTSLSGAPLSVFDYGKDVRTFSLNDFASPYLYGKSMESQMFTNAFSTASTYNYANSQSITNNNSTVKSLMDDDKRDKDITVNINIDQMGVGTSREEVRKLMKMIEQEIRIHGKKW